MAGKNLRILQKAVFISCSLVALLQPTANAQVTISTIGTPVTQNFDGMGTSATATLPSGFRVSNATTWVSGTTETTAAAGTTGAGVLNSSSAGGTYNFADGITAISSDRALGFLNSSNFTSPRNIFIQILNNTSSTITSLNLAWTFEKYRSGARAFNWFFFHGPDGNNWTSNANGDYSFPADLDNATVFNPPSEVNKSFTISGISIAPSGYYYLRLMFEGVGGSTNGQAIGIDNFTVIASDAPTGPVTNPTDYFRSRQTGNWGSTNTWESSPDNINWINATAFPTSAANTITIRSGHTVTMTTSTSADQLIIENGANLIHNSNAAFTLDDGIGIDMVIRAGGTYTVNGAWPLGNGTYVVETNGTIRATDNTGGRSDDIAHSTNTRVIFQNNSNFIWANTQAFQTDNITYFSGTTTPNFIIETINLSIGANTPTIFNGRLIVRSSGSIILTSAGIKDFRDGIIVEDGAFITQQNTTPICGKLRITGSNAILGGPGTINLNSNGLEIVNGSLTTLVNNIHIEGINNFITVTNGSRLDCGNFVVSGSATFVVASGGQLGIGSAAGVRQTGAVGNIQTSSRIFSSEGSYIYNGTTNQVTGGFATTPVANRVRSLHVSNTGNTVTLSDAHNNLTVDSLVLNQGFFAAGITGNLNIVAGGIINGNGGHSYNGPEAGTITFIGYGRTRGISARNPELYRVIINGEADFNDDLPHSAEIIHSLQLNNGSYVSDAPFYRNGSSLIYNINGGYARNVEWGSSANQGYPHHVIVQGNTILDLNTHTIAPAELTLGGDLIIGNSTGRGEVYMNNSMNKRLVVRGNLIIGSTGVAAANNSRLRLSDVIGGDLVLHGNFERHSNGFFDDVGRATFLRGNSNTTISTPGVNPAPDATTQNFSYLYIDKNSAAQTVTLNCPVGINNLIDFSNGIVVSSAANFLQINSGAAATGASFNSFVHGTVRKVGTQDFLFPTGFLDVNTPHFRPIGISSLSGANTFIAEFVRGNPRNLGPISAAATAAGLSTISGCEYWNLSRLNASNTARVTLSWSNDNRGLSNCNVGASAYVKPGNEAGLRVVPFNNANQWGDVFGNDGVTTNPSISTITWNGPIPTYTRFVLGSIDWRFNPLPFRFTQFTATGRGKQAQLDWSVLANANILTYTIERGTDGRNFSPIFSINSNTEAGSTSYRQYDASAPGGWNYYRLRATDHLGEHHFSAIQKVWLGSGAFFQMGPNPASNTLNVTIGAGSNWRQVQVTNAVGQVLLQQPAVQGTRNFNLSKLPAGIYYLRLLGDSGTEVHPFVKE